MGWRSTIYITRNDAVKVIMNHLLEANNEQLENMLMECQKHDLNNFSIVDEYPEDPDARNFGIYNNPFEE